MNILSVLFDKFSPKSQKMHTGCPNMHFDSYLGEKVSDFQITSLLKTEIRTHILDTKPSLFIKRGLEILEKQNGVLKQINL